MNICFVQDCCNADAWQMEQRTVAALCCFGKVSGLLLPATWCLDIVCLFVDETVNKQSRNNQHYAQICTTALFYMLALSWEVQQTEPRSPRHRSLNQRYMI
jgi:ribonuclease I